MSELPGVESSDQPVKGERAAEELGFADAARAEAEEAPAPMSDDASATDGGEG
ncbi:MAG: hypothetical protein M3P96_14320 [Actinomycetota bacterium]|nr:hypothetical protein [Actinomycetota bacterium]